MILRTMLLTALTMGVALSSSYRGRVLGEDESPATSPPVFTATKKWSVLHRPVTKAELVPLSDDGPIHAENGLSITGVKPGHPFWFGSFESDADWGAVRTGLHVTRGKNAALRLARAGDFDLEGTANAEGLGGWFFVVGWRDGHGYLIYNVTLKESGSPWIMAEVRGGRAIEETHREIARHEWKGPQPFRLAIAEKSLGLIVGKDEVFRDVPLPNYAEGNILVGTYDTRYGPKKLRIQSLRIRGR